MRPSKRTQILDAALRVVERDGVTALTYESLAEETELTKAGLVYHFPSREALLDGLQQHLAQQWETAMTTAAGAPAETLSDNARLAAYAKVATQRATRAELLLILETAARPTTNTPWTEVVNRWTPPTSATAPLSPQEALRLIAYLAADGLWLHEALTGAHIPHQIREQLAEQLAHLTNTEAGKIH